MFQCKVSSITMYFNSTVQPFLNVSRDTNRTAKAIGNITVPPSFESPSITPRNVTVSKANWLIKSTKPYLKKADYMLQNATVKNRTKEDKDPVINQRNFTEMLNTTDQILLNSNFSGTTHSDNLTYLQEEASSIQNSERIGIEEEIEDGVNISGSNLSAAGITGITLGCVVVVGIICCVSYFMYHNQGFNRPQVLNDHCSNPDSSGYIDDASVRVSMF